MTAVPAPAMSVEAAGPEAALIGQMLIARGLVGVAECDIQHLPGHAQCHGPSHHADWPRNDA